MTYDLRRRPSPTSSTAPLRADPGRPLVTFYDDATGERTELSVTTYANWVAKTASLLVEELDLERGDRCRLDLPTHWLGPVFLGAAWTAGLVVDRGRRRRRSWSAGPDGLARLGAARREHAGAGLRAAPDGACASPSRCPPGVHDVGVEVWSQPDAFAAYDPPGAGRPRRRDRGRAAVPGGPVAGGRRRESPHRRRPPPHARRTRLPLPVSPPSPSRSSRGGSVVLVARADPARARRRPTTRSGPRPGPDPVGAGTHGCSADQVVVPIPSPSSRREPMPLAVAVQRVEPSGPLLAGEQVRVAGQPEVADAHQPVVAAQRRSPATADRSARRGRCPGRARAVSPERNRLSGAPSPSQRPTPPAGRRRSRCRRRSGRGGPPSPSPG